MTVTTRGRVVGIRSTSAGALVRTRLQTTDASDGSPLVTTFHASIYRGVAVDGPGCEEDSPAPIPAQRTSSSQSQSIPIAREAAHVYTECAGIWNPIHSERRVALAQGFPDVSLHGTATWAIAGRYLTAAHAAGDPEKLKRLRARFKAFVIPGHPITLLSGARSARGEVAFAVRNHLGDTAVEGGLAVFGD